MRHQQQSMNKLVPSSKSRRYMMKYSNLLMFPPLGVVVLVDSNSCQQQNDGKFWLKPRKQSEHRDDSSSLENPEEENSSQELTELPFFTARSELSSGENDFSTPIGSQYYIRTPQNNACLKPPLPSLTTPKTPAKNNRRAPRLALKPMFRGFPRRKIARVEEVAAEAAATGGPSSDSMEGVVLFPRALFATPMKSP